MLPMECNKADQNTCLPVQITQWRVCTAGWAHLCMTAPTSVLQGFSWLTQARIQSWRNVRVVAGVNNTNLVLHSRRAWLRCNHTSCRLRVQERTVGQLPPCADAVPTRSRSVSV